MSVRLQSFNAAATPLAAAVSVIAACISVGVQGWSVEGELLTTYLAFSALIAVSDMLEVTLPTDVRYSLGLAPGLGLLLWGLSQPTQRPIAELILVFAVGMAMAALIRALRRRSPDVTGSATSILIFGAAVSTYKAFLAIGALGTATTPCMSSECTRISIPGFLATLAVVMLTEAALRSLRYAGREQLAVRPIFLDTVRSLAALHLSIMSVGALLALAYPSLGKYKSFPLFLAPLAATQFAFKQFASIRSTYVQTIRALSKVPEMAGYTSDGHSTRVADLAVAVARELGVPDREIGQIEYAALLHDIGRISIPDPDDAENATATGRTELATIGATIVRDTGHFPQVADMIGRQYDFYRRRGEDTTRDLPIGSKIIKVCSAYDDFTDPLTGGSSSWDAIERLHLGTAYDWDPVVIQALMRVLEKRGDI